MKALKFFIALVLLSTTLYAQSKSLPDFTLESIEGERISLYNLLKTGPVYINFWALWCVPCRSELKVLQSIYEQFKDKSITILAINIDTPRSSSKVKSFISSQKYSFPVLLDPNSEVFQKFGGTSLPFSILVDKNGKIVKTRNSFVPGDEKEIIKDIENVISKN